MTKRWWICLSASAGLCLGFVFGATAQEKKDEGYGQKPDDKAMEEMQAWMKAGMPNENHKRLDVMAGNWKTASTMSGPSPDEAMTSTGTCKNEWIMGGRYLMTEYRGEMMGRPFEGAGVMGYDNLKKQYFSAWIDNMSTMLWVDYGTYDAASKSFTLKGEFIDPMSGPMKSKSVWKIESKDKYVLTMYQGKDYENMSSMMEVVYTRDATTQADASKGAPARLVKAGCGMCIFHMDGVRGCKLAVEIDGRHYLVRGADVDAHSAGLCGAAKMATCEGKIEGDVFVASAFKLKD